MRPAGAGRSRVLRRPAVSGLVIVISACPRPRARWRRGRLEHPHGAGAARASFRGDGGGQRSRAWSPKLAVAVAVTVARRSGRDRAGRCRGTADGGEAGGGHEEVLDALAGYLVGVVVDEGVQQVAVVGDLVAVGVVEHGELAAHSGRGGHGRRQRRATPAPPPRGQTPPLPVWAVRIKGPAPGRCP